MEKLENPGSIISLQFSEDQNTYFVVGTTFVVDREAEPTKGRILVFSVADGKAALVSEIEIKGAVYSLCEFNGKILASVNSKVR